MSINLIKEYVSALIYFIHKLVSFKPFVKDSKVPSKLLIENIILLDFYGRMFKSMDFISKIVAKDNYFWIVRLLLSGNSTGISPIFYSVNRINNK